MPAAWTQNFDFYIGMFEGAPMLVRLDMAAIDHAPVASHPTAMRIDVPMRWPKENGLRSDEEADALLRVEDILVPAIAEGVGAIYWGRHVTQGRTEFMFYVEADRDPDLAFLSKLRPLLQVPDYSPTVQFLKDPNWTRYRNSYPSAFHKHTMSNRQIQSQLESMGDQLTKRRMIDHLALFPTAEGAHGGAEQLKKGKFRVAAAHGPDESGSYLLGFRRKDSCQSPRPDEITSEIMDCIEASGGAYDGWGCAVKK
jgi:Family of unknown function (DUF695)/Regulator of ribonuclease activity B